MEGQATMDTTMGIDVFYAVRAEGCKRNEVLSLVMLWDIRQTVRTWAEDIVRMRYQETTSED
jgi:hypothetical protein